MAIAPVKMPKPRGGPATQVNKGVPYKPPKTKTHPVTGLPVMPSAAEVRAEANAQAWKSVQAQQAALPSEQEINRQYGSMGAKVSAAVDAHRAWLENAGQYQVSQANALSSMVSGASADADAAQTGAAGLAGVPGGQQQVGNVSPTASAMPVAAYGTSFANYLHSLAPYADAIGGNAMAGVLGRQSTDLQSLRDARTKIAATLPDLEEKNFTSSYGNAINEYKGELAALVAGGKNTVAGAKVSETNRHNTVMEGIARDNAETSSRRADAAINAAGLKGTGKTASEVSGLKTALAKAFDLYQDKGGEKAPGRYGVTLTLNQPSAPGRPKAAKQTKVFAGDSLEQVRALVKAFLKKNNKPATGPVPVGVWSQDAAIAPVKGSTVLKGKEGESTRRLKAWRYLVQQNSAAMHPLSTPDLKKLFREGVGAPPGSK